MRSGGLTLTNEAWTELGKPYGFTHIAALFDPQGAGRVLHMTYLRDGQERVWFAYFRPDETYEESEATVQRAVSHIAEAEEVPL